MKKKIVFIIITCMVFCFTVACSKDGINISSIGENADEAALEEWQELERVEHTADGDASYKQGAVSNQAAMPSGNVASNQGTEVVTVHSVMQPQYYSQKVYVYVCGKVANPGVYELPTGSRIYEAINMAGGMTQEACVDQVNQALPVEDGMQITVPGPDDVVARQKEIEAAGLININRADVSELTKLTGIGESRAKAIVEYRENQGLFTSIEDIMNVPGIKQGAFEKIKDQIVAE